MKKYTLMNAKQRFLVLMSLILLLVFLIILRLFWLQVVNSEHLSRLADEQISSSEFKHTPRGKIVDRNGEELAVSIMTSSLYVDPEKLQKDNAEDKQLPKRDAPKIAADLLAPVLKMNPVKLHELFAANGRFLWVKRTLEPRDTEKIRKIIQENKLKGLGFLDESKRYYTKKRAAAQVLGFVGTDDKGLSGIEMELDSILSGARKKSHALLDGHQNKIIGSNAQPHQPVDDLSTVYLTLDSKIQYVLEDAMDDAMARTKAKGAAAIIMDPYTGEILGMASRPTFDPNHYYKYSVESWNNKGVSMIYEPGSVFKPIVGCMGLTEGIINPNTIFQDNGSIKIADRVIHNWDGEGMGPVPFSTVIKFSINTGMVQLGMQLGAERLTSYSKKFGFGSITGVDLPGEECGILYNPKDMYEPDVATMSIGQGIAVTPLQMLRAICAIANGGELIQPYIVKKIVAPNGDIIQEGKKKVVRNVITAQVAEQMRGMMEKVVSEGGGKTAAIKGYRIAGKTGTAEKLAPGGGYAAGQYIASFVGFVPADKPRYAMLVMLDTPQGVFYGSQVSAPIFRDTLQQILVAKGVMPEAQEGLPSFEELHAVDKQQKIETKQQIQILPDGKIKLPDLSGTNMREAIEILHKGGLRMKPYGSGNAYQQKPAAGETVASGTTVEVWFK